MSLTFWRLVRGSYEETASSRGIFFGLTDCSRAALYRTGDTRFVYGLFVVENNQCPTISFNLV